MYIRYFPTLLWRFWLYPSPSNPLTKRLLEGSWWWHLPCQECITTGGSSEGWCSKMQRAYGSHRHFGVVKLRQNNFIVHHFAGQNIYTDIFIVWCIKLYWLMGLWSYMGMVWPKDGFSIQDGRIKRPPILTNVTAGCSLFGVAAFPQGPWSTVRRPLWRRIAMPWERIW